ncbi:hypothetical protein B7463_g10851, partial [Scytalidium lignicola]
MPYGNEAWNQCSAALGHHSTRGAIGNIPAETANASSNFRIWERLKKSGIPTSISGSPWGVDVGDVGGEVKGYILPNTAPERIESTLDAGQTADRNHIWHRRLWTAYGLREANVYGLKAAAGSNQRDRPAHLDHPGSARPSPYPESPAMGPRINAFSWDMG